MLLEKKTFHQAFIHVCRGKQRKPDIYFLDMNGDSCKLV